MRSRLIGAVLAAIVLLLPNLRPSQAKDAKSDAPQRVFNDPFLENLVGRWRISRAIRGTRVENSLEAEWVLHHQFLQLHMKDTAQPSTYEALVLIGYSTEQRKYVAHWCDTYGGEFSAVGRGTRSGDSIEFVFQYADGPFYNTFTWDAATRGWVFRMENTDDDGHRVLFAEDTLRKR